MHPQRVREILDRLPGRRIGVVGDFCLDAYWTLAPACTERSVETGRPVRRVTRQRYSLGGAGNVAANLAALGVGQVAAFGVIGNDPFGRELGLLLDRIGVDCRGIAVQPADWDTPTYGKPHLDGVEQDRLDFGGANVLADASADQLTAALSAAWPSLDALIVNQQLTRSIWSRRMLAGLRELIKSADPGAARPVCVLDSRDRPGEFPPMTLKLNSREAARMAGEPPAPTGPARLDQAGRCAGQISLRTGRPVFVTLGEQGSLVAAGGTVEVLPAVTVHGPVDPVGAGDASLAALTAALAVGASGPQAAALANLAAAVTVTKIGQTGTASPEEIMALARGGPAD